MKSATPTEVNPVTLTPNSVRALFTEAEASKPEGSDVGERLTPIERALAARMDAALVMLTEACELERAYAKSLEDSPLGRLHRFERYGPARSASYVQEWSVGRQWRAEKIKAGCLPAKEA